MSSAQNRKRGVFYGYIIVIVSFLIFIVAYGAQYSFGIFFKPLIEEFGWSRASTSGAYSLNMLMQAVFGIFAGRLTDKFGPRVVVTAIGIISGLGYILMFQAHSLWQVYLFYGVLASSLVASVFIATLSTVARWFFKRRGLMSGILVAGVGVGTMIVPPLAQQLINLYDWRTSYVIFGVVVLLVTVICAQFLRHSPEKMGLLPYGSSPVITAAEPGVEVGGMSLREAVRKRSFWLFTLTFLLHNFCLMTVMVHIVPFATDIGIAAGVAAGIISVIGGVSVLSKIGFGWFSDRVGVKRVIVIAFILLLASFLWILLAGELWMLLLFAFVFSLGYGAYVVMESPVIAELFGLKAHGAILGLSSLLASIGCAVGPIAAGGIFDATGSYHWAWVLCAVLIVMALVCTWLLKPVKKMV